MSRGLLLDIVVVLGSPSLLPSCSVIAFALQNTIILIIIHLSTLNQHRYLDEKTCVSLNKSRLEEGLPAGMMYYPEGYEHSVVFKDTEGEKKSGGEKEVTKRITSDY